MNLRMGENELNLAAIFLAEGINEELVKAMIDNGLSAEYMQILKNMCVEGMNFDNVLYFIKNPNDKFYTIYRALGINNLEIILYLCEGEYDEEQLIQIRKMINENITIEELRFYGSPIFNSQIMKHLRKARQLGLSLEMAKSIFLKPEIEEVCQPEVSDSNDERG
jgi:hypothetical protein